MKQIRIEREEMGYPLICEITLLDDGIHLLIVGGCCTHVGSISVAEFDGAGTAPKLSSKRFPGHKDHVVGDKWAVSAAEKLQTRAVVVCGIHYDGLAKDGIGKIVAHTDKMLEEFLALQLTNNGGECECHSR